jgi:hypothetical protein
MEYDSIINYLTTEHDGGYLTVAKFEELLSTVDSTDFDIKGLQMAWQSCCGYLWDIQRCQSCHQTPLRSTPDCKAHYKPPN